MAASDLHREGSKAHLSGETETGADIRSTGVEREPHRRKEGERCLCLNQAALGISENHPCHLESIRFYLGLRNSFC